MPDRTSELGTRGPLQAVQMGLMMAFISLFFTVPLSAAAVCWYSSAPLREWLMPVCAAFVFHTLPPVGHLVFAFVQPPRVAGAFLFLSKYHPLLVSMWVAVGGIAAMAGWWAYDSFRAGQCRSEIQTVGVPIYRRPKDALLAFKLGLRGADGVRLHPQFRIRQSDESEHILIVGSTGSGKTQVMSWPLEDAIQRGDCAVIQDVKGDFAARFAAGVSPEDAWKNRVILLAPWDVRSARWHISADIERQEDADLIAEIFVPIPKSGQPFFAQAGRRILSAAMFKFSEIKGDQWGWPDLWNVLRDPRKLVPFLYGTDADSTLQFVPESSTLDKQSAAIYSTLMNEIAFLRPLASTWPNSRRGVSIKWLIEQANSCGWRVILGWRSDWKPAAGPLSSAFYSLFISRFLAMGEGYFRRPVWLVMDEFSALPKISSVPDFLRLARSYGGRMMIGIQDVAAVREKYGRDEAESVLNNFGLKLAGRIEDEATASWAAKSFGQIRVKERTISTQEGARIDAGIADDGMSRSISWQERDKAALVSSDFLHLPKASKQGFKMWIKASAMNGQRLMGCVAYPIRQIEKPYPPCVPWKPAAKAKRRPGAKPTASSSVASAMAEQQPAQERQAKKVMKQPQEKLAERQDVQQPAAAPAPAPEKQREPVKQEIVEAEKGERQEPESVDPVKEIAGEALVETLKAGLEQAGAREAAEAVEAADAARQTKDVVDAIHSSKAQQEPTKQEQAAAAQVSRKPSVASVVEQVDMDFDFDDGETIDDFS